MNALSKMRAGERYCINDPELIEIRDHIRDLTAEYNQTPRSDRGHQRHLINKIFAKVGDDVHIEKSMNIDYGINTMIGSHVFINFNFTLLDCAPVTIGDHVFIGPNVQLYTAHHPLDAATRDQHIGWAEPITIGCHVWIGGGCIILPGVTIGDGAVVGAGSVVTKDIPAKTIAFGNPCRPHKAVE
ncbi:sugar O-acetyltransferase [Shewanella sp. Isolate11]|uniref:sugar O-acetyltransferase n=1 Tax=Shewanella sp. Isolate11 TaxID=2908530 RepID=UPI001EFE5B68|nr:sugar O-acetyltransferase [Shewanella sp. Isolate11]MCG9696681.1 sugar O-acetyltransferase [Shewanella sp. Isolate11]